MAKAVKVIVALGGNALQEGKGPATAEAQLDVVKRTCEYLADTGPWSAASFWPAMPRKS